MIEVADRPPSAPPPSARMLSVIGGIRAGVRHPLPSDGCLAVGRDASNDIVLVDPSVSRHHAEITGTRPPLVIDVGSRNGVTVDRRPVRGPNPVPEGSVVRLGATSVTWRVEPDDVPFAHRAGLGTNRGTTPFNRPPRPAPAVAPAVVPVPAQTDPPPDTEPISWAGVVLPVLGGTVVAIVWSPLFALFAALGPVVTIGTWYERRRRTRRTVRNQARFLRRGLADLAEIVPTMRRDEIERRILLDPDPSEVVRRATAPSVRCWERRPSDPDFMHLAVGTGDASWEPTLDSNGDGPPAEEAAARIAARARLADVPVVVDLRPGEVLGLVGPATVTRSIARSLVLQVATHHGPADVGICVVATREPDDPGPEWGWTRWLPHTVDVTSGRPGAMVGMGGAEARVAARTMLRDECERPRLAVIDGAIALVDRDSAGRMLLADPRRVAAIVVVPGRNHLPAVCTRVVEVRHLAGEVRIIDPRTTRSIARVTAWGVDAEVAALAARGLARLDDPDLPVAAADLPASARLVDLLGGRISAELVAGRWSATRGSADLRIPIGVDGNGPVWLDLVADGPHVLVGGTTGSGKSELLRSIVAGLALAADPDHVALVLVDYKGGAAFDRCADLPHVAGLVTDLDDRLAARALRCLEAELRRREERFREVGAEDMESYRAAGEARSGPLPRLVVIIDEFATLASDLPDFLDSLVGIAQRGRSLGVHMVLATQRPAGVVTEDIRANTNCRISLRVTDRQDSIDVLGAPDAAAVPRDRPGRGVMRMGPDVLVPFQSALVTGRSSSGAGVTIRAAGHHGGDAEADGGNDANTGPSDLDVLVEEITRLERSGEATRPLSPWPPPLPPEVDLVTDGRAGRDHPAAWLVDDPDGQAQRVEGWDPGDGHLVVVGGPASGTTTTLVSVALDLCRRHSPDRLHIHAIDLDSGSLHPLERLPHVGTIVALDDAGRRSRLIRVIDDIVAERRAGSGGPHPPTVLVIDDLAGLARAHDPVRQPELHDRLDRIWSEGPAVGVCALVSVKRAADLTPPMTARVGVTLIHRVPSGDGSRVGVGVDTSGFVPGRAIRADDGLEVQVGRSRGSLAEVVESIARASGPPTAGPTEVGHLDSVIAARDLPVTRLHEGRRLEIRIARDDARLEPCGLTLHAGDSALVLGPPRSGLTNTLAVIGRALAGEAIVVGPTGLGARAPSRLRRRLTL